MKNMLKHIYVKLMAHWYLIRYKGFLLFSLVKYNKDTNYYDVNTASSKIGISEILKFLTARIAQLFPLKGRKPNGKIQMSVKYITDDGEEEIWLIEEKVKYEKVD